VRNLSDVEELTIAEHTRKEAWKVNEQLAQLINLAMFENLTSQEIIDVLKEIIKTTSPPIQGIMSRTLSLLHIATTKALLEEKYGKVN
jgi:hypothetical protein